jgi:aerobic carbon-monoxide dehydrogenase medium subunit
MRVPAIETALKANWSAAPRLMASQFPRNGMLRDIHGSAYCANLVKVMAQRAVTAAG